MIILAHFSYSLSSLCRACSSTMRAKSEREEKRRADVEAGPSLDGPARRRHQNFHAIQYDFKQHYRNAAKATETTGR